MIGQHHRHGQSDSRYKCILQSSGRRYDGINPGKHDGGRGNQEYRADNRFWNPRQHVGQLWTQAIKKEHNPRHLGYSPGSHACRGYNSNVLRVGCAWQAAE